MKFKAFEFTDKNEISMIEVAHAILSERGEIIDFSDLVNQIQIFLEKEDSEIRNILPQFYTDLNIDGSFISLGENRWGLRAWYPIDSIDEEVSGIDEEDDETIRRKKRKKVNAFIATDEDAIDYNDDDPEDSDHEDETEELYDEEDETKEIKEYTNDLTQIGETDEVEVEVEGLTIIDEDDLEDSDLFEDDDEDQEELEKEEN